MQGLSLLVEAKVGDAGASGGRLREAKKISHGMGVAVGMEGLAPTDQCVEQLAAPQPPRARSNLSQKESIS